MNEHLKLSPAGEGLVKHFEGCRLKAYYCSAGKLTIGWGHTNDHGRRFHEGAVWTRAEADAAFVEDMAHFGLGVKRLLKREASQEQYDALISFAYNCGLGALKQSTVLRKFNAGDLEGAARAFHAWNKVTKGGRKVPEKGLTRRRASEALLFLGVPDRNYDGRPDKVNPQQLPEPDDAPDMPQAVAPPEPPKSPAQSKSIWTTLGTVATSLFAVLSQVWEETKWIVTDPTVLLVVTCIIVAGGCFLVHDRTKKLTEDHV